MIYDKSKTWTFDLECLMRLFSAEFRNMETDKRHVFVISEYQNDSIKLFQFMKKLIDNEDMTIGFNSMFYDQPMLHHFLKVMMSGIREVSEIHELMHEHSQWLITEAPRFHRERQPLWQDLDVYRQNHFDNRAKATSLKKIEVFLKMENVMESSIPFDQDFLTKEEVDEIIDYQEHDVLATKLFAQYCEEFINFRFSMVDRFGPAVLNYSDSKIGSELMNKELIDKMGYDKIYKIVNGERKPVQTSYPEGFNVGELLFPYIKFDSDAGKAILDFFSKQVIFSREGEEGTGAKGVFNKLDFTELGELNNYVELDLTPTQQRKQATRNFIRNIKKNPEQGEFDKKGYPVLPKNEFGKPLPQFDKMNTYRQKYWDHLHLSKEEYKEKWKKKIKDSEGYRYCAETFKLPSTLKHLNVVMGNAVVYLGVGGAHQSVQSGIYKSDKKQLVIDSDIVSFYPSLSIENFLAPKHYDIETWVNTYEGLKKQRLSYDKKLFPNENKALKLSLNTVYGNSSNLYSPIRDPAYTVSTCINGQLTILMLIEKWLTIPGLKIISTNTDGCNASVPVEYLEDFVKICKEFEKETSLQLENAIYDRMLHKDVNNFLYSVYDDGLMLDELLEKSSEYISLLS